MKLNIPRLESETLPTLDASELLAVTGGQVGDGDLNNPFGNHPEGQGGLSNGPPKPWHK
jgi:hypothetical protein